ncbi:MAG: ATP-binding protein [Candidatus Bathyarchaeota archaeon]|nr:ATP-binding protein [Candidatus Bathyarchaeota archaeon]
MSSAEVYGLKDNPFEPTGAAVDKYPFVPPANFPMLEQKIIEAGVERKLYALLVNSPHGAGKSTTMEYLKKKASNGGYLSYRAPVLLTRLANLSIEDFVRDVLKEATPFGKLSPIVPSKFGTTPSMLRKALVETLSPIATKHKLMLWIVDEFDILADQPEKEQRSFLQFLRDVVDDLAKVNAPIAFIMSHTKYSSRQFEANLSKQHEPFRSRLVASLPLSYSFPEVKKIVFERLRSVSISTRQEDDISPFSEEALKALYDLILAVRGTESLDNFRVFERICHFALIEGAKKGMKTIEKTLVQELFKEYGLKELPIREGRNLSIKTSQEIVNLKTSDFMQKHEAILQGVVKGIRRTKSFGDECIKNVETSFLGCVNEGIVGMSSLSANIILADRSIRVFLVLASSKEGILQVTEINAIMQELKPLIRDLEVYSHKIILAYVSSIQIPNLSRGDFDQVIWIRDALAEDLMGLSAGVEEDVGVLIKSFESDIAPVLGQLIIRETTDITAQLSAQTMEIIQTLFVISASGEVCTKEALRQDHKRLFMRKTKLPESYVVEAIQSGFIKEQANQLEPTVPKAHNFLLDLLEKGPLDYSFVVKKLGVAGEAIIKSAIDFGLVYLDGGKLSKRRFAEYENSVKSSLDFLRTYNQNAVIRESEIGQLIEWLVSAYDQKKTEQSYALYIILSTIQKLSSSIQAEITKYRQTQVTKPSPLSGAQVAPPIDVHSSVVSVPSSTISASTSLELPQPMGQLIDDIILTTLRKTGPLLLQELDVKVKEQGYQQDVKPAVLRLIYSGKLKVSSG